MQLVPLCSIPKVATRNGLAGRNAMLVIPGYGFWWADGKIYNFPNSQVAQDKSQVIGGTYKTLPYSKGAGICIVPGPDLTPVPAS